VKRNALLVGAAIAVAIVLLWYFVLYAPLNDDLSSAQDQVAQEQKTTQSLQAKLAQLESQKQNGTQQQALLRRLDAAVPKEPDLAEFIIQANDIADQSGIEFLSIAPTPPAAGSGVSVINLTITISGGFFQLQDYLRQLEQLERLVIVDGINVSASTGSGAGATGLEATSSGTSLSVTLTGRMFTRAAAAATPGGTGGTTTPTTPSTSTPGESTTTTTTAGSTTGGT